MVRVTHLITGLDTGGAEISLLRLLEGRTLGVIEHSVISLTTIGTVGERIDALGIPLYALGARVDRPGALPLFRLVRLLRELQPDVLQTWLYHADVAGTVAGRVARVPNIAWNIRGAEINPSDYRRSLQWLLRLLTWLSRIPVLVISNSHAGRLAHERLGYKPSRWEIVPNGIDSRLFQPSRQARVCLRQRLNVTESTQVVALLARYHPMKDHLTFLRAAATVAQTRSNVAFVAAGRGVVNNGALLDTIDALTLGGSVALWDEEPEPAKLLAGCDVAVMSSAYGEGFPNVVAEAMACGVPCVVTDVGDAATIVGDTGIVVPPRNPDALARGILHFLSQDRQHAEAVSIAARARVVDQYSLDRAVSRYENLYMEIAGRTDAKAGAPCVE